jgi:predicted MFS family arabinose efflux permease
MSSVSSKPKAKMSVADKKLIFASALLSGIALLIFNAQPIILGSFASSFQFNDQQLGYLAGAELFGVSLMAIFSVYFISNFSLQKLCLFGCAFMSIGNIVSLMGSDFTFLILIRFLTGFLGEGIIYAVTLALIGRLEESEVGFSFFVLGQMSCGVLGLFGFPLIAEPYGYIGVASAMAIVSVLCIPFNSWIPKTAMVEVTCDGSEQKTDMVSFALLLFCIGVWFVGLSALWAFFERWGVSIGMTSQVLGSALGSSLVVGGAVVLLVAWMGERFGISWQVPLAFIVHALLGITMYFVMSEIIMITMIILFSMFWNFGLPYMLGWIARIDVTGRFIVLLITFQGLGNTLGPTIAGNISMQYGYDAIALFSSACCVISFILYFIAVQHSKSRMVKQISISA